LFCVVLCIVCVYMCTVLLPAGGYPIAVKYISYHVVFLDDNKIPLSIIAQRDGSHKKKLPLFYGTPKLTAVFPILSQINPLYAYPSHFPITHFSIFFLSMPGSRYSHSFSFSPLKPYIYLLLHKCHMRNTE